MTVNRTLGSCLVVLLFLGASLGAAKSDVADAVMRGDGAAVRAIAGAEGGRQRAPGRRGDGAPLGGLP